MACRSNPGVAAGVLIAALMTLINVVGAVNIHVSNGGSTTLCAHYYVVTPTLGACKALGSGSSWRVAASGWKGATFWAVDGSCPSSCSGGPPSGVTQFELTLQGSGSNDYYDVSSVAGFNVGVSVQPSSYSCSSVSCQCDGSGCDSPNVYTCASGTTDYNVLFTP